MHFADTIMYVHHKQVSNIVSDIKVFNQETVIANIVLGVWTDTLIGLKEALGYVRRFDFIL